MAIKKTIIAIVIALIAMTPVNIKALDDGAYQVGRSTSYVNPLTGQTEDGGSNLTLGDSMVQSIVENKLLLEKSNNKYYLTIGLGLASNVSNVRFKIMNQTGNFSNVNATITGNSEANGDTVNHYRLELTSLDNYISPIMYVEPMGRDVQFFIKVNINDIISGTGIYTSKMVSEKPSPIPPTTATNQESTPVTPTVPETVAQSEPNNNVTVTPVTKEDLFTGVKGISNYLIDKDGKVNRKLKLISKNLKKTKLKKDNSIILITGIGAVAILVIAGGIYYVKKGKE